MPRLLDPRLFLPSESPSCSRGAEQVVHRAVISSRCCRQLLARPERVDEHRVSLLHCRSHLIQTGPLRPQTQTEGKHAAGSHVPPPASKKTALRLKQSETPLTSHVSRLRLEERSSAGIVFGGRDGNKPGCLEGSETQHTLFILTDTQGGRCSRNNGVILTNIFIRAYNKLHNHEG